MTAPEATEPTMPPSFPPKSAPPASPRARMRIRNRQTVALAFRADPWTPKRAAARALATIRGWGYPGLAEHDLERAVLLLVEAVVKDGGKRVSLHLGDQDEKILVIALSHRPGTSREGELFDELGALATLDSCGDDLADDGRRLWALLDASPRRRPDTAARAADG
ncbi:hypothetical protein ABZZ17_12725 [Streptomyces sp. NPDC006512]|uniref:hypothetical protein n=1 Tax=Streptomyces sp. NPDC006512 TaxID=3154307 RepID=UPI0033A1CD36